MAMPVHVDLQEALPLFASIKDQPNIQYFMLFSYEPVSDA